MKHKFTTSRNNYEMYVRKLVFLTHHHDCSACSRRRRCSSTWSKTSPLLHVDCLSEDGCEWMRLRAAEAECNLNGISNECSAKRRRQQKVLRTLRATFIHEQNGNENWMRKTWRESFGMKFLPSESSDQLTFQLANPSAESDTSSSSHIFAKVSRKALPAAPTDALRRRPKP